MTRRAYIVSVSGLYSFVRSSVNRRLADAELLRSSSRSRLAGSRRARGCDARRSFRRRIGGPACCRRRSGPVRHGPGALLTQPAPDEGDFHASLMPIVRRAARPKESLAKRSGRARLSLSTVRWGFNMRHEARLVSCSPWWGKVKKWL